jgi:hypothetical protein
MAWRLIKQVTYLHGLVLQLEGPRTDYVFVRINAGYDSSAIHYTHLSHA